MSLTTLSSYLAALGGRLEVRAVFPDHPEENVTLDLPGKVPPAAGPTATGGATWRVCAIRERSWRGAYFTATRKCYDARGTDSELRHSYAR